MIRIVTAACAIAILDAARFPKLIEPTLAADATSQSTTQSAASPFRPRNLVPGKDSFVVMLNGQPRGYSVATLSRESDGYHLVTEFAIPAARVTERREMVFDSASLAPVVHSRDATAPRGIPLTTRVKVVDRRATGTAQELSQGAPKTTTVDIELPVGTVDDEALGALIPTIDLRDGLSLAFKTFYATPGDIRTNQLTVQGRDTVTVPVGTFETYRVELKLQSGETTTLSVTTTSPFRIVRIQSGALELRRAK